MLPAPAAGRVVAFCLGTFLVYLDGRRIAGWRGEKAESLLQYLLSHPAQPVARGALTRALWPHPAASSPADSLKDAVDALRKTLVRTSGAADRPLRVTSHRTGYRLQAEGLWVDVAAFEHDCAVAERLEAEGRTAEAHNLYARAVHLYAGDFLPNCQEEWAGATRRSLFHRYQHARSRLAGATQAAGDYAGVALRRAASSAAAATAAGRTPTAR